jgi:hypothetical protein
MATESQAKRKPQIRLSFVLHAVKSKVALCAVCQIKLNAQIAVLWKVHRAVVISQKTQSLQRFVQNAVRLKAALCAANLVRQPAPFAVS